MASSIDGVFNVFNSNGSSHFEEAMLRQPQHQQGLDPTSYYTTWSHVDSQTADVSHSFASTTDGHTCLNPNQLTSSAFCGDTAEKFKASEQFAEKLGGTTVDRLVDGPGSGVSANAGSILDNFLANLLDDDPHSQLSVDNGFCDDNNTESKSKNTRNADVYTYDG